MTQAFRLEAVQLQGVGVFDNTLIRFKPIASAERDEKLAEVHLFTGPNGCGKSTLLYALAEIFEGIEARDSLIYRRFRDDESHVDFLLAGQAGSYGRKLPNSDWFSCKNDFGPFIWRINEPNQRQVFGYSVEDQEAILLLSHNAIDHPELVPSYEYSCPQLLKYKKIIPNLKPNLSYKQTTFFFAAFAYSGQRTLRSEPLTGIQEITNSPFESALSFDITSRPKVLLQWIANNRTKSALAKMDNNLQ